jgi:hypothetical protein
MKRILEAREEGGGGSRKGGKDEEDSDGEQNTTSISKIEMVKIIFHVTMYKTFIQIVEK